MSGAAVEIEKIAEAVLYEGYLLFPYRRSALKNQLRWTFGGVYPREYSEASSGHDPWLMQTQCLVAGDAGTEIEVKVRFLQVVERKVARKDGEEYRFVEELRAGGQIYRPWEEAMERESILGGGEPLRLDALLAGARRLPIEIPAGRQVEPLLDGGEEAGALVREWGPLQGSIDVGAERLDVEPARGEAPSRPIHRLTARIVNTTPWPDEGVADARRGDAVRRAFISTHTILRATGGEFVSLLEPPPACAEAASRCENVKTWPILVGEPGDPRAMLSSPIILYDYPRISPESRGNYFDATEIDELLALSVLSLTDEEKHEMRESDARGREILERTEALSEEQLLKMHGVVRYLRPEGRERK